MEATKIFKSIRKLDKPLRKRFRLYLMSPYFNRSKTYLKAFTFLSDFVDKNPNKKLTKQAFWKKIFGKEPYKELNLRKLNSDLLRLLKDFLALEQYRQDEGRQINYLMRAVHRLGLDDLQSISIRMSDQYFIRTPYRNADYYLQRYNKEKEYYQLIGFDKRREAKSNVEDILRNLDLFYLSEKLYFYTSSIVRRRILSHDFQFLLMDEIMEHLRKHSYDNALAVSIYYHLVLALTQLDNTQAYEKLKQLITDNIHLFPPEEATEIYTGMLNFAVAKINRGAFEFNREYVDLIEQMIEKKFILEADGYVALNKFRNACQSALRLKMFDWTEKFIDNFGPKLPPDVRESGMNFTRALLYFRRKQFDKVIPLLSVIEYDDVAFGLTAKIMLAHTFYELEEFDVLESHLGAFRVFLSRRKDIPKARRENYLTHLRYLQRLMRLIPGDKEAVDKFIKDIKAEKQILNATLLIEKAEALR